jgi:hypothetical protein
MSPLAFALQLPRQILYLTYLNARERQKELSTQMSTKIVTTQKELDAALKAGVDWIEIRSERGVWLEVTASGSSTVTAYGSSTVTAYGSSTVTAYGSSTVTAYDSSTVTAYDSSTVTAYGSSTVTAYGSSTVTAYDSSTVTASSHTAVHLHSGSVSLHGGVVIDHTKIDLEDAAAWAEYHGVDITDGVATVYKAVDDKYTTNRGFDYSPGATPSAPDWKAHRYCGNGLHFGPTPAHALAYHPEATKFMEAKVALKDLIPINNSGTAKCKAPSVMEPLIEVDIHGRKIHAEEVE